MVDLPPSLDELNEYGRFSFLNEMHTMAAQIAAYVSDQPELQEKIKAALEAIEEERGSMRDMFETGYQRPHSKQVVSLILRCAELYLDYGLWYDLCHAELRLREKHLDDYVDEIRTVFHDTELTDRYSISSPIIELTLTRLEMMAFFNQKQEDIFIGVKPLTLDPLSHFELKVDEGVNEATTMNNADIPDDIRSPDDLMCDDDTYLLKREEFTWHVYRQFRPVGSLFCLIYYFVTFVVAVTEMGGYGNRYPVGPTMAVGFSLVMCLFEIASVRMCFIACARPKQKINCLYPGIELYFVQAVAAWIGGIAVVIGICADKFTASLGVIVLAFHQLAALILAFCFLPCFFTWHKRAERSFKWVRIKFFESCAWIVVMLVFCVFLTPGIYEVQMMIAYNLRNKPTVGKMREQKKVVVTV